MMLYVNGQDISRLVLAGLSSDGVGEFEIVPSGPENYLKAIDNFLQRQNLSLADLHGIVIVSGPGSPTSLRASHAIVNALAFAHNLPVIALEKPLVTPDESVASLIAQATPQPFAFPHYGSAPKITTSPRDALKRKL